MTMSALAEDKLNRLAIFGGVPSFREKLHVGRPNIVDRQRLTARINDLLDRRWLSNDGPYVQDFERRIADFVGVKHCVAMCNATLALEIGIRATGMKGEVIVPSFTFIATAHALQWQGITPVFCDIDPKTHNLDPDQVERLLSPNTSGIIGVHVWGRPCCVEPLTSLAARHNLKLLFDSAHAFGCSYQGRMIGSFGDAEVFSFHATKFLNTLEGGAVVTNDDKLAEKMRLLRNFGFADYDLVVDIGTNAKMNEVSAAVGLGGLEQMDEFIATNRKNHEHYRKELASIDGVSLVAFDQTEKLNYQYVVVEVDQNITRISRDHLLEILWAENVLVRRYFYPGCHRMEPYATLFPSASARLPETENLAMRVLVLPTGTSVTADEITQICDIIKFVTSNGSPISDRLLQNAID
jgi:dTDP-4-amino-4,6-dideoxygalactose transaminase